MNTNVFTGVDMYTVCRPLSTGRVWDMAAYEERTPRERNETCFLL